MIYAEQGNRVKQISENEIQKYVEQGYKIIDDKGKLMYDCIPNDIPTLKLAYTKHIAEINKLHAQIDDLKNQLSELEQSIKKTVVVKESKVEDIQSDEVVTPKATRKRKSEADKAE